MIVSRGLFPQVFDHNGSVWFVRGKFVCLGYFIPLPSGRLEQRGLSWEAQTPGRSEGSGQGIPGPRAEGEALAGALLGDRGSLAQGRQSLVAVPGGCRRLLWRALAAPVPSSV